MLSNKKKIEQSQSYATVLTITSTKAEEQQAQTMKSFKDLGLNAEQLARIEPMIKKEPDQTEMILALFKNLKGNNIDISPELLSLMEQKVAQPSFVYAILVTLAEYNFPAKQVPINLIWNAARVTDQIFTGLFFLNHESILDLKTVTLLFSYPEDAIDISSLLTELKSSPFFDETIQLLGRVPKESMDQLLKLLTLIINNHLYYPGYITTCLPMDKNFIEKVNTGLQHLESYLSSAYLELAPTSIDPCFFAKTIKLFAQAGLINTQDKSALAPLALCGQGTFRFLQQLDFQNKLDKNKLQNLLKHNTTLDHPTIIKAFKSLFIGEILSADEVQGILKCLDTKSGEAAVEEIAAFIRNDKVAGKIAAEKAAQQAAPALQM